MNPSRKPHRNGDDDDDKDDEDMDLLKIVEMRIRGDVLPIMNSSRKPHRNGDDDDDKDDEEMDLLKIVEMRIRGNVRVSNVAEPSTPAAHKLIPAHDPGMSAYSLGDDAAPSVRQAKIGTEQEEMEWTENSMFNYENDDMFVSGLAVPSDNDGLQCNNNPPPSRLRIPTLRRQTLVWPQTNHPGAFAVGGIVGDDEDSDVDSDDVPVCDNHGLLGQEIVELPDQEIVARVVYEDNDQELNSLPQAEPMTFHKARRHWKQKLCVVLSLESMCAIVVVTVLLLALLVGRETKQTLRGEVSSTELQQGVSIITEPIGQTGTTLVDALNLPEYTLKAMENPRSPQSKAYRWLSSNFHTSKSNNRLPGWRIVQKFTLAVFYYSTGGDQWVQKHGWLDWEVNECDWEQWPSSPTKDDYPEQHCDSHGRLRSLTFAITNNLDGTIPPEIALLSNGLELLEFNKNFQLRGTVPTQLGMLRELSSLRIADAHGSLSGVIPTELGLLKRLTQLQLSSGWTNERLPSEIANLHDLTLLLVEGIRAPFPTEIYKMTNLLTLSLENQKPSAAGTRVPVPTELGRLTKLEFLGFVNLNLTGTVPEEVLSLTNLKVLGLRASSLSGTLQQSLSLLTDLEVFFLSSNQFKGNLDSNLIAKLTKLGFLAINDNPLLTGVIPTEIGLISSMKTLKLHNTHISGTLPTELLMLKHLTHLVVTNTSLSGRIPDELCNRMRPPQPLNCFGGNCYEVATANMTACHGTSLCGCSCGPCPSK